MWTGVPITSQITNGTNYNEDYWRKKIVGRPYQRKRPKRKMEKAIDAQRKHSRYDPVFEALWTQVLHDAAAFKTLKVSTQTCREPLAGPVIKAAPKFKAASTMRAPQTLSASAALPRRCKLPRVGTVIERSTIRNRRKFMELLIPPPPLPRRFRKAWIRGKPRTIFNYKQVRLIQLFGDTLSDLSEDEAEPIPSNGKRSAKSPSTGQPPSTSAMPLPIVIAPSPSIVETPPSQTVSVTPSPIIFVPPTLTSNTTLPPATSVLPSTDTVSDANLSPVLVHLNDVTIKNSPYKKREMM